MSQLTVHDIAQILGGTLRGDGSRKVLNVRPLNEATENDLTFFAPSSKRKKAELFEHARRCPAAAILVREIEQEFSAPQILTPNPLGALIQIASRMYHPPLPALGVHPTAILGNNVTLGKDVKVGAYCVVGDDVVLGDNVIVHPHVVIYAGALIGAGSAIHSGAVIRENVILEEDCYILNGAVIGGDGFGYIPDKQLGHRRIPHIGTVRLEAGVDIGANSTVDRATFGTTLIGKQTKIDNLVMVGHNVRIGARSLLCGQVGISGSSTIGQNVILAGQAGVADHVTIANNVRVGSQAGVVQDILEEKIDVAGHPAGKHSDWKRNSVLLQRLPELFKAVRRLERIVEKKSSS